MRIPQTISENKHGANRFSLVGDPGTEIYHMCFKFCFAASLCAAYSGDDAIIHPRMPFSRVMKISFRPETKKVSAHMKISGRPENSDRPEKAK